MSSSATKPKCGFTRKPCMEHECAQYMKIAGMHPQTGEIIDRWDCGFNAQTMLLLDLGKAMRQHDGELSAFRNEQDRRAAASADAMNKSAEAMSAIRDVFTILQNSALDSAQKRQEALPPKRDH